MAIDTARRRKSAVYGSLPFRSILPTPDGNVEAEDRYNIAWHYSGLVASAPRFLTTITNILIVVSHGAQIYDLGSHFSGAASYAISPSVEASWTFATATGLLTIDTDSTSAGNYGPYTVTATNGAGSVAGNAFLVTIAATPKGIAIGTIASFLGTAKSNTKRRI